MAQYFLEQSSISHFLYSSRRSALLWLAVRLYIGYEWIVAGWEKVYNPAWVGDSSGAAITGFVNNALTKTAGAHPDVQGWYAAFLQNAVLTHPIFWSNLVAFGEVLVGAALIAGIFVGLAAFFGASMNLNFMLAGTVSINPIMLVLSFFLILAWRVAGRIGLDRFVLPIFSRSVHRRDF